MIEINLIPVHLRKKEYTGVRGALSSVGLPREVFFGIGGLVIAFLVLLHVYFALAWIVKFSQHSYYQVAWQRMSPDKNTMDSIGAEVKELKNKISTITNTTSKGAIVWSQKLNVISDNVPRGIWLKRLAWGPDGLILEGSAVSRTHDETAIIGNFVSSLKKDGSFSKDFVSVDLNSVTHTKVGTLDVADFIIKAKIK